MKKTVRITLTELPGKEGFYKSEAAEVFTRFFCERLETSSLNKAEKTAWLEELTALLKAEQKYKTPERD